MTTTAERLRRRREELGLSRRKLAEMTGLPTSKIWSSEHDAKVDPEAKKRIVDALNERTGELAKLKPLR